MQFPKLQLPKSVLAAVLDPHCSLWCLRGPNQTFGELPLGKLHIWEVAACGSFIGKLSVGKNPLGKYLTSNIFTWEVFFGKNAFEEVPNTTYYTELHVIWRKKRLQDDYSIMHEIVPLTFLACHTCLCVTSMK